MRLTATLVEADASHCPLIWSFCQGPLRPDRHPRRLARTGKRRVFCISAWISLQRECQESLVGGVDAPIGGCPEPLPEIELIGVSTQRFEFAPNVIWLAAAGWASGLISQRIVSIPRQAAGPRDDPRQAATGLAVAITLLHLLAAGVGLGLTSSPEYVAIALAVAWFPVAFLIAASLLSY